MESRCRKLGLLATILLGSAPAGPVRADLSAQEWTHVRGAIQAVEPGLRERAHALCRAIDPASGTISCQAGPDAKYGFDSSVGVLYSEYHCLVRSPAPGLTERRLRVLVTSTAVRRDGTWRVRRLEFPPAAHPSPPPDSAFVWPSPMR